MNLIKRHNLLLVIIFLASFVLGGNVLAASGFGDTLGAHILDALSTLVYVFVMMVGKLIGLMISVFVWVIQYNNFGNEALVLTGWEIIRDLCNMGFVVILLVIAIASILQIDTYGYKNRLFKIMMMAVLINFSKLFTLLLIDISQYVMLEFAAGIKSVGAGNFIDVLNINTFLNTNISEEFAATKDKDAVSLFSIAVSIILAGVVSVVALFVIAALTIIIIIRIVGLWLLIIFSPIAYLLAFSPFGQRYSSQWWGKFTSYCVTGPVMVFLVWLSLASLKATTNSLFGDMAATEGGKVGLAAIGSPSMMGSFLFACIMLLASLKVASELGGMAATVANKASGSLRSWGNKALDVTKKAPGKTADFANRFQAEKWTGVDLNLKRSILPKLKAIGAQRKTAQLEAMQNKADSRFGGKEGLGGMALAVATGTRDMEARFKHGMMRKNIGGAFKSTFGTTGEEYGRKAMEIGTKIKEQKKAKESIISHEEKDAEMSKLTAGEQKIETEVKGFNDRINEDKKKRDALILAEQNTTRKSEKVKISNQRQKLEESISSIEKEKQEKIEQLSGIKSRKEELAQIIPTLDTASEAKAARAQAEGRIKALENERNEYIRNKKERTVDTSVADDLKRDKINKEVAKLESDPDANFNELGFRFNKAMESKKSSEVAAILQVLAKNDDLGKFLKAQGYNEAIGLTREEAERMTPEEIEKKKGLHDFVRENLVKKLDMKDHDAFNIESTLAGLSKKNGNLNFAESVITDEDTNAYTQVSQTDQAVLTSKILQGQNTARFFKLGGSEKMFGGINKEGDFDVNALGLDTIVGNYKTMQKEIDSGNFNALLASKLSEKQNIEKMKSAASQISVDERDEYLKMVENLEAYATKKGGVGKGVKKRIETMAGVIENVEKGGTASQTTPSSRASINNGNVSVSEAAVNRTVLDMTSAVDKAKNSEIAPATVDTFVNKINELKLTERDKIKEVIEDEIDEALKQMKQKGISNDDKNRLSKQKDNWKNIYKEAFHEDYDGKSNTSQENEYLSDTEKILMKFAEFKKDVKGDFSDNDIMDQAREYIEIENDYDKYTSLSQTDKISKRFSELKKNTKGDFSDDDIMEQAKQDIIIQDAKYKEWKKRKDESNIPTLNDRIDDTQFINTNRSNVRQPYTQQNTVDDDNRPDIDRTELTNIANNISTTINSHISNNSAVKGESVTSLMDNLKQNLSSLNKNQSQEILRMLKKNLLDLKKQMQQQALLNKLVDSKAQTQKHNALLKEINGLLEGEQDDGGQGGVNPSSSGEEVEIQKDFTDNMKFNNNVDDDEFEEDDENK